MTSVRLKDFGTTFATRQRADAVVSEIRTRGLKDTIEINFEGVKAASPSFLDAFMGGLGEIVEEATLTSVQDESLMDLLERVIERRGFQQRFRILATV